MSHYDHASTFSDLSSLDGSDDFGQKLLQHTKDAQRIHALAQSHAFSKAKPLPRAALNLDNLERNNLHHPPVYHADHPHPASLSGSTVSDPPLNPPRAWGRKGRPNHAWMRHIHSEGQAIAQSSPNIDWLDAANHSVLSPAHVSPVISNKDGYSGHWDPDQDFSAASSLLVSTPAVPSRSRLTIEQIRHREIQTYENHASLSQKQSHGLRDTHLPPRPASASNPILSNIENIPPQSRHSAPPLYKTVETSEPVPTVTPRSAQRKTDSLALLKRLSRTPSASPSPTSAQDSLPAISSRRQDTSWSEKYPKSSSRSLFRQDSPQAPEVIRGPEVVHVDQGDSSQAPEVVELPEPASSEPLVTPARSVDRPLPAKTPVVMGAWVDTPQTVRQPNGTTVPRPSLPNTDLLESIPEISHQRAISEPNLPASALDAVLKDLRAGKRREDDDPTLGDSTIASLEQVMAPSADNTMRLELPDVPSAQPRQSKIAGKQEAASADDRNTDQEKKNEPVDLAPTSQNDRDLRQRWFAMEGLKKRLGGTSAKHEVGNTLNDAIASAVTGSTARANETQHIHQHLVGTQCTQCGRPTSVLRAAWNEYWGWYFRRDTRAALGFRSTWLGLVCLLFWTWLATEWLLSSIVSPPKYATKMRGFGVDPHAPRFPYALPTLALRPLSPILSPLVSSAVWFSKIVLGQEKYKYYPASPGGWGSAAKVNIGPPGPRSAYFANSNAADDIRWAEETTAQTWQTGEEAQQANSWSTWELNNDGSMLDDELIT